MLMTCADAKKFRDRDRDRDRSDVEKHVSVLNIDNSEGSSVLSVRNT
jgi:hypothetical protein